MVSRRSSVVAFFALIMMAMGLGHLVAQEMVRAPSQSPAPVTADNPLGLTPDHATISVANIDKEEAWYNNVLGFTESQRTATGTDYQVRRLSMPGVYQFDLVWSKGSVRHAQPGVGEKEQGWMHLVFKVQDIDAAYKKLKEKDPTANVSRRNKDGGINTILLSDPEGNVIEIQ